MKWVNADQLTDGYWWWENEFHTLAIQITAKVVLFFGSDVWEDLDNFNFDKEDKFYPIESPPQQNGNEVLKNDQ